MGDFERAILCEVYFSILTQFDPTTNLELKKSARIYIEKFISQKDIWKVVFDHLFKTKNEKRTIVLFLKITELKTPEIIF